MLTTCYGAAMKIPVCTKHTDEAGNVVPVEHVVFTYCPLCRASHGGKRSLETLTTEERKRRARKAAKARWKNAKKGSDQ